MARFRDLPIRRRVNLLIAGASALGLVLAGIAVLAYDLKTLKPRALNDVTSLADIVRVNSTAALQFRDPIAAAENLATLAARPEISAAAIFSPEGDIFASYVRPGSNALPFTRRPDPGHNFTASTLRLTQPVISAEGETLGWLTLQYDLPTLAERLPEYGLLASVLLVALFAVSLLMSRFIMRSVTAPILRLEGASRAISERKDYRIRAEKRGEDEIGRLTDAFNAMLQALEEREAALRESTRQLMDAMVAARMGSWSLSIPGGTLAWDGQEERLFGKDCCPPNQTLAAFLELVHTADRAGLEQALRQAATEGKPFDIDFRIVAPDGRLRWFAMSGQMHREGSHERDRIFGLVMDVTERRHLEEQLIQSQKMEAIGRLAGGIAHDFNNLLTGILGYARFAIASLPEGDGARADVMEIERAGTRAAALTSQLLAYARRQMIAPRVTSLNDLVRGMDSMVRRLIGEDIVLDIRCAPDLWSARVDPTQFEQVILNLTVNARDAMPEGGQLSITTGNRVLGGSENLGHPEVTPGPYVMLKVSDTGSGMDAATQARIFEPFFTTKEQGKGTGLGLAVAYGIIAQAGGHILVASELGQGTTFSVLLPRATEVPESELADTGAAVGPAPRGDETVLVAEDEPLVRKLAVRILGNLGYRVLEAADGPDALALAESQGGPIHLLVTDVVMPGMTGKELATTLKERYRDLRVIYMSGYAEHLVVQRGVLDDGIAFIPKPFDPVNLARTVREVLDHDTLRHLASP
jgi:signal transduction histidine kinase/HAMP domain-containing protein/ActR/RegA family two-component response regulator